MMPQLKQICNLKLKTLAYAVNVMCLVTVTAFSSPLRANEPYDPISRHYPIEYGPWKKAIPVGFLNFKSLNSDWVLVQTKGAQETYVDRLSIKTNGQDKQVIYGVFKTTRLSIWIDSKPYVEELSYRALNCEFGGTVILKSVFKTQSDTQFVKVYYPDDVRYLTKDMFPVETSCDALQYGAI
jgi:hypothetical protein